MNKKFCFVLGTRPEIIKLAPIMKLLKKKKINFFTIFTNQHYDKNMSDKFFEELKITKPKYKILYPKIRNSKYVEKLSTSIKKILIKENPYMVIVQGDTNSSLAGAIATKRFNNVNKNILLAHVEAGLRSYDYRMPEEFNRQVIDNFSDILFPPTIVQKKILLKEGFKKDKIFVSGSTICDSLNLIKFKKKIKKKFVLLTIHRHELLINREKTIKLFNILKEITVKTKKKIIFFCHPRTLKILKNYNIKLHYNFNINKPVSYKKFLNYLYNCEFVLSDSGGIQEEACILKKHLITLRLNTERPETVTIGSNFLSMELNEIINRIKKISKLKPNWKSPYGYNVSKKILREILNEKNFIHNKR